MKDWIIYLLSFNTFVIVVFTVLYIQLRAGWMFVKKELDNRFRFNTTTRYFMNRDEVSYYKKHELIEFLNNKGYVIVLDVGYLPKTKSLIINARSEKYLDLHKEVREYFGNITSKA